MAIDTVRSRLNQDSATIRTHDIALNPVHLLTGNGAGIKEHRRLQTRLERTLYDTLTVSTQLCIRLPVSQRLHSG